MIPVDSGSIIHHTRRSAIIDYDIYHGHGIVSKANVTVKINLESREKK